MEKRTQFTFYESYYEAVSVLNVKDRTAVIMAICKYALYGEEPKLTGVQNAIFTLIRPTLNAGAKKSKAQKQSVAERKKNTAKQLQTNCKTIADELRNDCEKEKEKENEIEIEIENECLKEKDNSNELSKKKFAPPSLEEVQAYCKERGNSVDAAHFVDYYTANGWHVGKQNMKDWKAAVRTWEHNGHYNGAKTQGRSGEESKSGNVFLEMLKERGNSGL